jgi:hypothetical protein
MGFTKPVGKAGCSSMDLCGVTRAHVEGFRRSGHGQDLEFVSDVFCRFLKDCDFELMAGSCESCLNGFDWSLNANCRILTIVRCFDYCGSDKEGCVLKIIDANSEN